MDGIIIINENTLRVSADDGSEITMNETHIVTFQFSTINNGTKYMNLRKILNRKPGIAGSPLLNIVSHNPVLSVPQPFDMIIFGSSKTSKTKIIAGEALSVILSGFIIIWSIHRVDKLRGRYRSLSRAIKLPRTIIDLRGQ